MNLTDLKSTAENLAKRYKNSQEHDDLVSEGLLAGLEALEKGKEGGLVLSDMRKAMHDYYNISLKPVSVPLSGDARAAVAKVAGGGSLEEATGTERLLIMALVGETDSIEANTLRTLGDSTEEHYLHKELIEYLEHITDSFLTKEEGAIIKGFYLEEKSLKVLSKELGGSPKTLSRRKALAIDKIKRIIKERNKR